MKTKVIMEDFVNISEAFSSWPFALFRLRDEVKPSWNNLIDQSELLAKLLTKYVPCHITLHNHDTFYPLS